MTENHNYTTPSKGTTDWHVPLNDNFTALDVDVPIWDTDQNRGAYAPVEGGHFVATDTGTVYQGDGSSWTPIGSIGTSGPELFSQADAPADPQENDVWFDQSEGVMKYFDGSTWVAEGDGTTSSGDDGSGSVSSDVYVPMDGMSLSEAYDLSYGTRDGNATITSNEPYAGSDCLDTVLSSGGHWGTNLFYYFPEHGHGQPDEVYSRIYIRLDPNWEMADSNTTCKLYWAGANLSAGSGGHGGGVPTGENGFSTRVFCQGSSSDGAVTPCSYLYHMDQDGTYGDMIEWGNELQLGQWHQVDTHVKLNSVSSDGSANADGEYRAWLDGSLQDEHTGLRFRSTNSTGIDRVGPGTYWGGTETSPRNNHAYFDEHRITIGSNNL